MIRLIYWIILFFFISNTAWATTKAWLIGLDKSIKLNIAHNTIEQEASILFNGRKFFYDALKGIIFILYSPSRDKGEIAIYDIKSLTRKGKLDIVIDLATEDDLQFIFPTSGNIFYVRWVKEEDSAPELVVYDATTYKAISRFASTPDTTEKLLLSDAGDILYSIVDDENSLRIDSFETSKFNFRSSVDIKKYFGSNVTSYAVHDYKNQKLLVSETTTSTSWKYLYDVSVAAITSKISTKGESYLLSRTNRIVNPEERYIGRLKSMSLSTDYLFTGVLNIFDATTSRKIGTVQIPIGSNTIGDILAVNPLEDKLYFRTYNASGTENPKLYVIDINSLTVAKEISLPESTMKMYFFEE